jgi:hypothetical protein
MLKIQKGEMIAHLAILQMLDCGFPPGSST